MHSKHASDSKFYHVNLTAGTPAKTIQILPHDDIVLSLLNSSVDISGNGNSPSKITSMESEAMFSKGFRYAFCMLAFLTNISMKYFNMWIMIEFADNVKLNFRLNIHVFYDETFKTKFGDSATTRINSMFTIVSTLYNDPSFPTPIEANVIQTAYKRLAKWEATEENLR